MNKSVYISRKLPGIALQKLSDEGYDVDVWSSDQAIDYDRLVAACQQRDALLCTSIDPINSDFLKACPTLKIISTFAVGFDNIDVEEARNMGIEIGHTPSVLTEATADIAFALMLSTARKMFFGHKRIIRGAWKQFDPMANLGIELHGKTLGVLGLGEIGYAMARKCRGAYDMEIIYHNRTPNLLAEQTLGATRVDFTTLLSKSDVLSVHCSLNPETKGIFNLDSFSQMKETAIFINTARGAIHNELDLVHALNNKMIWGAGLDVTNPEPMTPGNPLLEMEQVSVLPHLGSATYEARNGMASLAAENIIHYFKSGRALRSVHDIKKGT